MNYKIIFPILLMVTIAHASNEANQDLGETIESKCAIVITSRMNDNQDPYQYALDRIRLCKKDDILSVNSFLDTLTTKVYFNDLMRGFCSFNKQIIADVTKESSSLSCVHIGKERPRRNLRLPIGLNEMKDPIYYNPDYKGGAFDQYTNGWNSNPTPLKDPAQPSTRP